LAHRRVTAIRSLNETGDVVYADGGQLGSNDKVTFLVTATQLTGNFDNTTITLGNESITGRATASRRG
jgi:hypothetical protein